MDLGRRCWLTLEVIGGGAWKMLVVELGRRRWWSLEDLLVSKFPNPPSFKSEVLTNPNMRKGRVRIQNDTKVVFVKR